MTVILILSMIMKQMIPSFHLLFEFCLLLNLNFLFEDLQNSIRWGYPFLQCSGLQSTCLHAKDDTFKPVIVDTFFLQKSF